MTAGISMTCIGGGPASSLSATSSLASTSSSRSLAKPSHLDHSSFCPIKIRIAFPQCILNILRVASAGDVGYILIRGRELTCMLCFIILGLEFAIKLRGELLVVVPICLIFTVIAVIAVVSSTRCPSITGLGTGTGCLRL